MGILYEEKELIIKGLFSKKRLGYQELKSVEINKEGIVFTTREGNEITAKDRFFDDKEKLFKAIRIFNIEYRNQNELNGLEETFTREELDDMFRKAVECTRAVASPDIKQKLGEKYDIKIDIEEVDDYISMYLSLTEDGEPLKNMGDFDEVFLAYLVEWVPSLNCARYGIMVELSSEEKMIKAVKDSLQDLYDIMEKDA